MRLTIGGIVMDSPVILAPMAGVSDLAFRLLCREQGAGLLYTEMISAKAILYQNKNTRALMRTSPQERPISLQLFGSEPEVMGRVAAQIEEEPFDILDINMGCPVPKVVNNNEGSALMKDPERVRSIVRAVVSAVDKPVTVKIRKGFNEQHVNAVEIAKIIEDCGASAVAVHGRTREQYYSGKADWEIIRKVKEALTIPVIGNGDVTSPQAAERMIRETGCDGVMVGRAARGNPWIFRRINTWLQEGREEPLPAREETVTMILRHAQLMTEVKGERTAMREMRKHVAWYTAGFPHSAEVRRHVNEITTLAELEGLMERFSQS